MMSIPPNYQKRYYGGTTAIRQTNSAQEIIYRVTVSIYRRFLQVPLLRFAADLSKNTFVHRTSFRVVFAETDTHQEVRWHHNSDCGRRR